MRKLCEGVLEPLRGLLRESRDDFDDRLREWKEGEAADRTPPPPDIGIPPRPIIAISSGFRSATLNRDVGGAANSQHLLGEACDFEVPGMDNLALARFVADSDLPFDQLILEFHVVGKPSSGWVHVSHKFNGKHRRQVLTASRIRGSTQYTGGLPSP